MTTIKFTLIQPENKSVAKRKGTTKKSTVEAPVEVPSSVEYIYEKVDDGFLLTTPKNVKFKTPFFNQKLLLFFLRTENDGLYPEYMIRINDKEVHKFSVADIGDDLPFEEMLKCFNS